MQLLEVVFLPFIKSIFFRKPISTYLCLYLYLYVNLKCSFIPLTLPAILSTYNWKTKWSYDFKNHTFHFVTKFSHERLINLFHN